MLSSLIIIPDQSTGQELFSVLKRQPIIGQVMGARSFSAGRELIEKRGQCDLIFISSKFPELERAEFIEHIKKNVLGRTCSYVLIMKPDEQNSDTIAKNMMIGFHSFLCEPFDNTTVDDVAKIANKMNDKNTRIRLKAATGIMLTELQEDGESEDEEGGSFLDRIQSNFKKLQTLQPESKEVFERVVSDLHETSPAERIKYKGSSKRVREKYNSRNRSKK